MRKIISMMCVAGLIGSSGLAFAENYGNETSSDASSMDSTQQNTGSTSTDSMDNATSTGAVENDRETRAGQNDEMEMQGSDMMPTPPNSTSTPQ